MTSSRGNSQNALRQSSRRGSIFVNTGESGDWKIDYFRFYSPHNMLGNGYNTQVVSAIAESLIKSSCSPSLQTIQSHFMSSLINRLQESSCKDVEPNLSNI